MTEFRNIAVEATDLSKNYGPVVALRSVDLRIESGQYFVLLGPSGGGKTTILRLIGGFIKPSKGRILIHGQDVSELPPNKRRTSMVFQSAALFPHMTVERNVSYGLRLRRLPRTTIRDKVHDMLQLVGLTGYDQRMPHQLSGGQQQRVQLARALVLETDIILLDEPLAALDAKLRKDMCFELKRIQAAVGITFIHVTHNQEEAMTIADRIALIADGQLVEEGTARHMYRSPVKRFTADFVGENNILDGRVVGVEAGRVTVDLGFGEVAIAARDRLLHKGDEITISVRSELTQLLKDRSAVDSALQTVPGTYVGEFYLGLTTSHLVKLPDGRELIVRRPSDGASEIQLEDGQSVKVGWKTGDARLHTS